MSRRNALFAALAVAVVIAGAAVSYSQQDRFGSDSVDLASLEGIEVILDCPYGQASCILGQAIERALRRDNVDAVMTFGSARFYVCPGPGISGAPSPLCDRAGRDEGRLGYPVAGRGGEAAIVAPDAVQATLQAFIDTIDHEARDGVGDGRLTLYAFSCAEAPFPAQNVSCAKEGIILSAIVAHAEGPRRELLVFWVQGGFQGRSLPFTELWDGPILDGESPVLFETGGSLADLGDVHVIDQSLPR
jgi:hypothetical protein